VALTLEEARALVVERNAGVWEREVGVGIVVADAETEEYEWGWLFRYEPEDWSRVPEGHRLRRSFRHAAVDRETGWVQNVGSTGLNAAISRLLERRPEHLRAGLILVRPLGGLTHVRVSDRAFQPTPRPAG
jgi:hypothetical protein